MQGGYRPEKNTQPVNPRRVEAATDGSSLGNPGPGGWGWVTADGRCDWGSEKRTTNNRMELTAVLELLRSVPEGPLLIQSDSTYVINVFTRWLPGWRKRNMRTARGKPVENRELIEQIAASLAGRNIEWKWVRGHSGHALNETADRLATHGARQARQ